MLLAGPRTLSQHSCRTRLGFIARVVGIGGTLATVATRPMPDCSPFCSGPGHGTSCRFRISSECRDLDPGLSGEMAIHPGPIARRRLQRLKAEAINSWGVGGGVLSARGTGVLALVAM